jgi:diguanylate cyclase (GGDEF)-like protein
VVSNLKDIKSVAINRIYKGISFFGLFGVIASLSRIPSLGLQPTMLLHLISWLTCAFIFKRRDNISTIIKVKVLIICLFIVTLVGLFQYGLMGSYLVWALVSLILSEHFVNKKLTFSLASTYVLVFILSAYNFCYKGAIVDGGADAYNSSIQTWMVVFFGVILISFVVLTVTSALNNEVKLLLSKLNVANVELSNKSKIIEYQANHDILTGLPTLKVANDRLDIALKLAKRNQSKAAVLFLDLDGFKNVNDTYGHEAGDYVLRDISNRISKITRESDTVCRIGGDEFLIILSCVENDSEIECFCTRLINEVGQDIHYKEFKLQVGVSIGVSIYPKHAKTSSELKKAADEAMYKVKREGKNSFLIL